MLPNLVQLGLALRILNIAEFANTKCNQDIRCILASEDLSAWCMHESLEMNKKENESQVSPRLRHGKIQFS